MWKRKRVAICVALFAAIALGIYSIYELYVPELRSVEYHKRQLLKEPGPIYSFVTDHLPSAIAMAISEKQRESTRVHWQALVTLGYLEQRVFVFSNCPANADSRRFFRQGQAYLTNVSAGLVAIVDIETNYIRIIAPRDEMHNVEAAIRKFDVPEK
jgi:hypothetical protein